MAEIRLSFFTKLRFAKNNRIAVWTTIIAFFLGNTLMFCFGAVGGAFTGRDDIFYVMIAQGLAIPALIVLGANIWTTNNNALYTGGLAISNISGVRMKITTWIAGIIGTALALWLYWNFVSWLNILNCALPPIGILVILDYFRHRGKFTFYSSIPSTAAAQRSQRVGCSAQEPTLSE